MAVDSRASGTSQGQGDSLIIHSSAADDRAWPRGPLRGPPAAASGQSQTSSSSTKFKVETGACRDTAGWPLRHGGPRSDGGADGLSDYPEFQEFRRIRS